MSNTPRTDAAEHNMGSVVEPHYVVDADFSRYLERELAKAVAAERERCAKECIAMADDFELEVNQRGLVEKMKHRFGVK